MDLSNNSRYSDANNYIRDVISDIRFSRRKIGTTMFDESEANYLAECEATLKKALKRRHNWKVDKFNWPDLESN